MWFDDGIDVEELNSKLDAIRAQFDSNMDSMFTRALNSLARASEQLKNNLDKLERRIKEYAERLEKLKTIIQDMTTDVGAKAEIELKLSNYTHLLDLVQANTYFEDISEE